MDLGKKIQIYIENRLMDKWVIPNPIFLITPLILLVGCDQNLSLQNYDSCILNNMKGVDSDLGSAQIIESCRAKFPEDHEYLKKIRNLSPAEVRLLDGRAGISFEDRYSGTLYNGNESVTVTSVRVQITLKNDKKKISRIYKVSVKIPPQTTSSFGFTIISDHKGSESIWEIVDGKGFNK